jgi:uncharacterized membrane protein YkvI
VRVSARGGIFNRFFLPGFAFKAVVIGGGYATGRELVEFFLPSGPQGGLIAMLLVTIIWSAVCATTFLFGRLTQSHDYRTFFRNLLGPAWPIFEICYALFVVLILSVFGAAAGAIGHALFGWPVLVGSLALTVCIALVVAFGNSSVERLFKYVSIFLYATYAIFLALGLTHFGDRILATLSTPVPTTGWALGGLTYAGYNIIGAVVILPVVRHMQSNRDAVVAGLLAGPLAMIPAILFFVCMLAYYPEVSAQTLPSDFLLEKLNLPIFRFIFQLMIFAALLESGTGAVHAINERIAHVHAARGGAHLGKLPRMLIALVILTVSIFVAERFGLVALIAKGYRLLAWIFLAVYVVPLMTYGVWRVMSLLKARQAVQPAAV